MRIGALLSALLLAGSCASTPAAGEFRPAVRGELTVATATIPLAGFWEAEAEGGFEHGLARAFADRFDLSLRVIQVGFERLVAGDLGGADLAIAQITPTAAREKVLDFSTPYLAATPSALVRSAEDMRDLEAARKAHWAVEKGTTLATVLDKDIKPSTPTIQTPDTPAAVALLTSGDVDAVLLDLPVALVFADRSGGALKVAVQVATDDSLAVALPNDSKNAEAVDSAVRAFVDDGTIDKLATRWLGADLRKTEANVPVLRRE